MISSYIEIKPFGSPVKVRFECRRYQDGSRAVCLVDIDDQPVARLSSWFPESANLPKDAFYLKDWSENAPVVSELRRLDLLEPVPGEPVVSGFITSFPHRLKLKKKEDD